MVDRHAHEVRAEEAFWLHLHDRYPVTWWWWRNAVPAEPFPEWNAQAFQREAAAWLGLSQISTESQHLAVQGWGRFARLAAVRLQGETWRRPAAPLRQARQVLLAVEILAPLDEGYRADRVLDRLRTWLGRVRDVAAPDYWANIELDNEMTALRAAIHQLAPPPGFSGAKWPVLLDRAESALKTYRRMVARQATELPPPVPWGPVAHLAADEWRDRRRSMRGPVDRGRPVTGAQVLQGRQLFRRVDGLQYILRSHLGKAAYVRLESDRLALYYGPSASVSLAMGQLLAWWLQAARQAPALSWALTDPVTWDAWLRGLAATAQGDIPDWIAVRYGVLSAWRGIRSAMTAADAWLWLESAPVEEVRLWLQRIGLQGEAWAWIPQMVLEPGRWLMAARDSAALETRLGNQGLGHTVWTVGPAPIAGLPI
ncbi:MAG: hypothetical protein M0Z53_07620 [Thermaerobacter sp.]|nr:hypothetical protein [Thermaerobacter sp.]